MANDDLQSQQFIREVDEEFRRAQLKSIWLRFAPLIVIVCILVVAITAGYRGWVWWQARQASQLGDRFVSALGKIESGDRAGGEADLQTLAKEGNAGYSALARLRLAGEKAAAGDKAAAMTAYDAIADDGSLSDSLRGPARIRAALLALDTGDLAGASERAKPLDEGGNPWRHAAREILGSAAYQRGELQPARDVFTQIQQDAETPPDLWIRSNMMVSLIDGQLAAPGTATPAGAASPQAPAPAQAGQPATLPVPESPAVAEPLDAAPAAPTDAETPPAAPSPAAPAAGPQPSPAAPSADSAAPGSQPVIPPQ